MLILRHDNVCVFIYSFIYLFIYHLCIWHGMAPCRLAVLNSSFQVVLLLHLLIHWNYSHAPLCPLWALHWKHWLAFILKWPRCWGYLSQRMCTMNKGIGGTGLVIIKFSGHVLISSYIFSSCNMMTFTVPTYFLHAMKKCEMCLFSSLNAKVILAILLEYGTWILYTEMVTA